MIYSFLMRKMNARARSKARTVRKKGSQRDLSTALPSEEHCQAEALKLLGDYTTLRVIDFLRSGALRFTELQRALADTNSVTLTKRLKHLEAAGILDRREATFDRQSVTYSLTETGQCLLPVLAEIQNFTRRLRS